MKVLVIQTAFPGDAILTLPLIQKIKESFNASVDVVAIPSTEEIFNSSPAVDEVFVLDKKKKHKSIFQTIRFAKNLSINNYDKVFSPHRSFRSSLLVYFLKSKESFGFDTASFSFVYNHRIKYEKTFHEVQRNLSLLKNYVDIADWKIKPEINFSLIDSTKFKEYSEKKLVAIAPGTVWETKRLPEKYFVTIINNLPEDYCPVLIGGKSDSELCAGIVAKSKREIINFSGKLSIPESIYLISLCKLLVSNDSAPTHMAMAAGTTAYTIYTSTIPEFGFYPYLYGSKYFSYSDLDCKPCGIHGHSKCPTGTFDCAHKLSLQEISEEINNFLTQVN